MKLSFTDLENLDASIQRHLKIDDASIKDLQKMDQEKFESLLLKTVNNAVD